MKKNPTLRYALDQLALGSYAGGQLLNAYGLKTLLIGAMLFAGTGP